MVRYPELTHADRYFRPNKDTIDQLDETVTNNLTDRVTLDA